MLWLDRDRVMKTDASFLTVAWHGELNLSEGVVPFDCETKVTLAFPVLRRFVVFVECLKKVLCMFDTNVFYSEIINTEGKGDGAPVVLPETWCDGALLVAFVGQPLFE